MRESSELLTPSESAEPQTHLECPGPVIFNTRDVAACTFWRRTARPLAVRVSGCWQHWVGAVVGRFANSGGRNRTSRPGRGSGRHLCNQSIPGKYCGIQPACRFPGRRQCRLYNCFLDGTAGGRFVGASESEVGGSTTAPLIHP